MKSQNNYLTNIPQEFEEYGFCKTLAVRYEIIHLKHILTEIFVRRTIDIENKLNEIGWSLFRYIEFMTNRIRHVHHFSREYSNDINRIVKSERDNFFPAIELYKGLNNLIVLDYDGVVTSNNFKELYELCIQRCKTVICSANPTLSLETIKRKGLSSPSEIFACKGKDKKLKQLIELSSKYDNVFYIDNEEKYLEFAWIFGIKTFHWVGNKIKFFTLKTK